MRITEIESQADTEKKGAFVTLLNMLITKANSANTGITLSIDKLNDLMNNVGHGISYNEIDYLTKNSPSINNLIHTYDQTSVTLKTNNIADKDQEYNPGNQDTVKQMAKRAANKRK